MVQSASIAAYRGVDFASAYRLRGRDGEALAPGRGPAFEIELSAGSRRGAAPRAGEPQGVVPTASPVAAGAAPSASARPSASTADTGGPPTSAAEEPGRPVAPIEEQTGSGPTEDVDREGRTVAESDGDPQDAASDPGRPTGPGGEPLTEQQVREVETLEARDREVRAHEQAHKAAAGPYGGAIHYDYQTGPDAKRYAVGGHVPIDMSDVPGDPAATARKMQTVRRAALAPADPSSQDRKVAAEASQRESEARREASRQRSEEAQQLRAEAASDAASAAPGARSGEPSASSGSSERPEPSGAPEGPSTVAALGGASMIRANLAMSAAVPSAPSGPTLRRQNARRAYVDAWR